MPRKDGFKHVENCGVTQADINRGFTPGGEEEPDFPYPVHADVIGMDEAPRFIGNDGFLGRSEGWER